MTEITFNCEQINVNYINDVKLKLNYIFPYDENKTIYDYMKELKLIYDKLNTIEESKLTHIYEKSFLDYTVIDSDGDIVPQEIPLKNFRNYSFRLGPAWSSPGRNEIIEDIKYCITKLIYYLKKYENKLIKDLKKVNYFKEKVNKNFNYLN